MKKIILFIFIFISLIGYSQRYTTIVKVNINSVISNNKCIGFDFGGVNNTNNIYIEFDACYGLNHNSPLYCNIGSGYLFESNIFVLGLIGLYSKNDSGTNINYGGEIGYIFNHNPIENRIVLSGFVTNNTVGVKIGFTFKNNN